MARITVVNDYAAFLELVDQILTDAGHSVTTFSGDTVGIEEIVATDPELLIVDVMAKGDRVTGWDVLVLARANEALRDLPVIVSTAELPVEDGRTAELVGQANLHVLDKPFTAEQLEGLVTRLLAPGAQRAAG